MFDRHKSSAAIILMEPQMGENIGAAARAMANFGLSDLRIVNPRDGWPNERAEAMAAGAFSDIVKVSVFETLDHAMVDIQYMLATTARRRDMNKPVFTSCEAADALHKKQTVENRVAILFGRERNGLENDEVAKAHGIIQISTNPDFSSLNLGQSVLLLAYELFQSALRDETGTNTHLENHETGDVVLAKNKDVQVFLTRLEDALDQNHFFRSEDLRPTMVRNISNIFTRNQLNEQEVKTLQGILTALTK